jgi:hypothetical protein
LQRGEREEANERSKAGFAKLDPIKCLPVNLEPLKSMQTVEELDELVAKTARGGFCEDCEGLDVRGAVVVLDKE